MLVEAYWKPVYKHVRLKWRASNEEAKDLTQGFFTRALEKGFFQDYDPSRASFRTWLRMCLDGFVSNERTAAARLKRGGGQIPLDFDSAERELEQAAAAGLDPEECFHREWVRGLFSYAVETLRRQMIAEGKAEQFRLFERYDLDEENITYEAMARELGAPHTSIVNWLAAARRRFRRLLLDRLREITGDDGEFESEARFLIGR